MMVILEKQGAGLNPLRRLHHAHVFRFCSVLLCPPPCACPKSSFYTALHRKLCHLVMKCKDKEVNRNQKTITDEHGRVQIKIKIRLKHS